MNADGVSETAAQGTGGAGKVGYCVRATRIPDSFSICVHPRSSAVPNGMEGTELRRRARRGAGQGGILRPLRKAVALRMKKMFHYGFHGWFSEENAFIRAIRGSLLRFIRGFPRSQIVIGRRRSPFRFPSAFIHVHLRFPAVSV